MKRDDALLVMKLAATLASLDGVKPEVVEFAALMAAPDCPDLGIVVDENNPVRLSIINQPPERQHVAAVLAVLSLAGFTNPNLEKWSSN